MAKIPYSTAIYKTAFTIAVLPFPLSVSEFSSRQNYRVTSPPLWTRILWAVDDASALDCIDLSLPGVWSIERQTA